MSPPFFLFNTLPIVCIYTRLLAIRHYHVVVVRSMIIAVCIFSGIPCIEVLVRVSRSYRQ